MRIKDDLIGREVLDSNGHEIGKVDDIDVDFDSERIDAIILHEGGMLRGKDTIIPFTMIETVGERVILKKESEGGSQSRGSMREQPMRRRDEY